MKYRNYIKKTITLAFETEQEKEDFFNILDNLRHSLQIRRSDMILRMGLQLLKEKITESKKRNNQI